VLKPKLLVAVSLLPTLCASAADRKHKQPMARQQKVSFVAFAYTSKGLTAEGKKPVAGKVIAADPQVLPMGTRVRVSGAGPWSGEYRVGDVGPKIKGNKIDVFVPSLLEAKEFGRRKVLVTVLGVPPRAAASVGTRARKAVMASHTGCDASHPEAMMTVDEARQGNINPASGSVAARGTGVGSQRSDSRQSGSDSAVARLSVVQRTSAN
jgi:3D (Asp-Asp-Asp) domain-containing protein